MFFGQGLIRRIFIMPYLKVKKTLNCLLCYYLYVPIINMQAQLSSLTSNHTNKSPIIANQANFTWNTHIGINYT